uniref:ZZ-type domain-containing protein n=1 Tax=Chromera velia CCMP2878 TaxID=1169474 RepID=A0A0G4FTX6_9ALVE|eukprot:Cvel_18768.t1-p1 / transcript=Cvel_18768.t1 / gene=Cvel_18768 / organism=Chromera_velia_CCMP2878 / gene_product=Transcriptional adapter 2, putative / transcript_product=Transcriptional adapter 2, putative / location=Cvel_scaffold1575:25-1409(-) / protein_length=130 / sequence_SO=supercontig / SO=protein_coding / is_pseudo=false
MSGFSLSQAIGQGPLTEEKEAAPSGVEKEKDSEKDATAAGGKEEETGAGSVQPTLGEMTDVDRFARLLSKLHCDRCQKDVSSAVRICCVESSDVDLCVDCFSKGAEKGDHKPWHKYVPLVIFSVYKTCMH